LTTGGLDAAGALLDAALVGAEDVAAGAEQEAQAISDRTRLTLSVIRTPRCSNP